METETKHLDDLLKDVEKIRDDIKICPLQHSKPFIGNYCGVPLCDLNCKYKSKETFRNDKLEYNFCKYGGE